MDWTTFRKNNPHLDRKTGIKIPQPMKCQNCGSCPYDGIDALYGDYTHDTHIACPGEKPGEFLFFCKPRGREYIYKMKN